MRRGIRQWLFGKAGVDVSGMRWDDEGVDETPEEQAAGIQLEQAIARYAEVSGFMNDGEHVGAWMVVATTQDPERPTFTGYVQLYPGGWLAHHTALGLVRFAELQLIRDMNEQYDEGEREDG